MRGFRVGEDDLSYEYTYHLKEKEYIRKSIEHNGNINIDDLRRIALWKYDRIIDVDDKFLYYLYSVVSSKNASIDDEEVQSVISKLVSFEGVGFPLASSILKFINPNIFPIIDVRAYRAIYGKKIYYSQYSLNKYVEYTKKLYDIAEKYSLPLAEVDERLYVFDKEHNGKL